MMLSSDQLPQQTVTELYVDVFNTGYAHFALQGTDGFMEDMGMSSLAQIYAGLIDTFMVPNPGEAAVGLGLMSKRTAAECPADSPLGFSYSTPRQARLSSIVILPVDFVLLAKNKPHIALSQLAFLGSQMRDAAHGVTYQVPDRAYAFESEFIRQCRLNNPSLSFPNTYIQRASAYSHQQYLDLNYPPGNLLPPDVKMQ